MDRDFEHCERAARGMGKSRAVEPHSNGNRGRAESQAGLVERVEDMGHCGSAADQHLGFTYPAVGTFGDIAIPGWEWFGSVESREPRFPDRTGTRRSGKDGGCVPAIDREAVAAG